MKYLQIHPWNHQIQLNQVNQANPSRKKNLICTAYQYCFSFDDWPTDHLTCSIQNNKYNNTALVCLQLSHLKHDVLGSCICVKPKTNQYVGLITSCCSGKEPALLPRREALRPDTRERQQSFLINLQYSKIL